MLDDIVFESQQTAKDALEMLLDHNTQNGWTSAADAMEIIDGNRGVPNDETYGWASFAGASIEATGEGFRVNLPDSRPL